MVRLGLGGDLGFRPAEDPELVGGAEVDEGEREGAMAGLPGGGIVEEEVADEVGIGGVRRRVDAEPIEV